MNLQFYFEKLQASENFKEFMRENPDAYLCSGFFVMDKEGKDNKQHFDFFVPATKPATFPTIEKLDIEVPQSTPDHPPLLRSLRSQIDNKKVDNDKTKSSLDINNSDERVAKATSQIKESDSERLGKMFSFQLERGIEKIPIEMLDTKNFSEKNFGATESKDGQDSVGEKIPEKISNDIDFSFEEIEKMILNEMYKKNLDKKIQKILLSLQRFEGKDFLIGTVFVSGLGMIKINIDIVEKKITHFEEKSFFDMLRVTKGKSEIT